MNRILFGVWALLALFSAGQVSASSDATPKTNREEDKSQNLRKTRVQERLNQLNQQYQETKPSSSTNTKKQTLSHGDDDDKKKKDRRQALERENKKKSVSTESNKKSSESPKQEKVQKPARKAQKTSNIDSFGNQLQSSDFFESRSEGLVSELTPKERLHQIHPADVKVDRQHRNTREHSSRLFRYRKFDLECVAVLGIGQTTGARQDPNATYFLGCETWNGNIHNVDGACKTWMDQRMYVGQLNSGDTILDFNDPWLNLQNHHIETPAFPPGLINVEPSTRRNLKGDGNARYAAENNLLSDTGHGEDKGHRHLKKATDKTQKDRDSSTAVLGALKYARHHYKNGSRHLQEESTSSRPQNRRELLQDIVPMTGTRRVLAVIIRLRDVWPSMTQDSIRDALWGTDGDTRTLKSYYSDCSRGELLFEPASNLGGHSGDIVFGTTTLYVPKFRSDGDTMIRNGATVYLNENFGVNHPTDLADHIIYIYPEGVLEPVKAYSFVNHWLTVCTDQECLHSTLMSHKIGHNMKLATSGNNNFHDDKSGLMGVHSDLTDVEEPQMCFNGAKLYQLGWFEHGTEVVSMLRTTPATTIRVHGFVKNKNSDVKMLVFDRRSPYDYYLVFNWASGHNSETRESANLVTISASGRHGMNYGESTLIAAMEEGASYEEEFYYYGPCTLKVKVESINVNEGYADISFPSCFEDEAERQAKAEAEALYRKIRDYERAVRLKDIQDARIAAAEANGSPIAPYVPVTIPPVPPYTPAPIGPTPAPTRRPTPEPTVSCLALGDVCYSLSTCCDDGQGACREEVYDSGGTFLMKCRPALDVNATANPDDLANQGEGTDIYGEPFIESCENGICEEGENCLNCPDDCSGLLSGDPQERYCCHGAVFEDLKYGVRNDDPRCAC